MTPFKQKFFKIALGIIFILLIIYLSILISPIFTIPTQLLKILSWPIIISGIFYYVLRPFCRFLEKKKIPRFISILMIYSLVVLGFALIFTFIWPFISQQIAEFSAFPTEKLQQVENKTVDIMNIFNLQKKHIVNCAPNYSFICKNFYLFWQKI